MVSTQTSYSPGLGKSMTFQYWFDDPEDELVPIESTEYWQEMEKNRIGNLLAGARLKAGLTQVQLSEKLSIRQNMISDYENGRRTYSDAMAKRLSKTLKVSEKLLKYGSEHKNA